MEIDERFSDIVALVEATSTERFFLWREFNRLTAWQSDETDRAINIYNTLTGRPINLCFAFVKINNKRVAFYECISQLKDYAIIDKWLANNLPNSSVILHCDALNFHQVVHECYPECDGFPAAPLVPEDFRELIERAKKSDQGHIIQYLDTIVQTLKWDEVF